MNETMTDRELDAYLAEHLFGWTWPFDDPLIGNGLYPGRIAGYAPEPNDDGEEFDDVPAYSSTGEGMLMVIEAMRERGWWFSVEEYGDDGPHQCVEFDKDGDDYLPTPVAAVPGSLPRAVAEAAAQAIRAEQT